MTDPITPLDAQQTAAAEQRAVHEGYLFRVLNEVDVLLNVVGGGTPRMTISARAALAAEHGSPVGIVLSELFSKFQKDHGALALAGEEAKAENVEQIAEKSGEITQ